MEKSLLKVNGNRVMRAYRRNEVSGTVEKWSKGGFQTSFYLFFIDRFVALFALIWHVDT
jgi:hypothetical protein